eukprot:GHVS01013467.1.p1 GENE.GHVS01013467.1~~GHVS01013467.1.p1  ORF type:complete len:171 (+),score=32.86 GHVS01013467.1:547-1059(+)
MTPAMVPSTHHWLLTSCSPLSFLLTLVASWKVTIERAMAANIRSVQNMDWLVYRPSDSCVFDEQFSSGSLEYAAIPQQSGGGGMAVDNEKWGGARGTNNLIDELLHSHCQSQSSQLCDDVQTKLLTSPSTQAAESFDHELEALTCLLEEMKPYVRVADDGSMDRMTCCGD